MTQIGNKLTAKASQSHTTIMCGILSQKQKTLPGYNSLQYSPTYTTTTLIRTPIRPAQHLQAQLCSIKQSGILQPFSQPQTAQELLL